jgi:hypothetical protein
MKNRNRIFEAPIDEPEGFRMNPQLKSKIERGETPYSDSPFLPKKKENERQSFEEKAATKRFSDVVGKLQRYLGVNAPRDLMGLQMTMMRTLGDIKRFETSRERELENMAVELAENELLDPKYRGYIKFDAKFMPIGGPVNPNLQKTSEEFSSEDIEQAFAAHGEDVDEFLDAFENFDYMVARRRFFNAISQGFAKKGHYMFELVRERLEEMEPGITDKYGALMAMNDYLYWMFPPETLEQISASGQGFGGDEEVDFEVDEDGEQTGNLVVKARGVIFPILVHELLKGYKDIILAPSLPEDPVQAQMVRGVADTAVNEIFDIIIGAYLWEKLREALPAKIFEDEEGMKTVQGLVFREMIKIPKRRFISLAQRVNSGDPSAYTEMEEIADTVIEDLNRMDLEEILGGFESYEDDEDDDMPTLPSSDDDDDDDNVDLSFLDDFGIDKPKG